MSTPTRILTPALVLLLTACASATDRLEEGMEAEDYGRYYQASMRYIDALEKDEDFTEARDRLMVAGDSAIRQGIRAAHERASIQDPVGAGQEFRRLDRLLRAANRVGSRLPLPSGFTDLRRSAFDAAIDDLMAQADEAYRRRGWATGREAVQEVRSDFEPSDSQRSASLEMEGRLLLAWAEEEEADRRYRSAFDLAGELLALGGAAPRELVDGAAALQERTVQAGSRFVAVFPVDVAPELRDRTEEDPGILLADFLEIDFWRQPPAFLAVADPVRVRQLTRRYAPPGVPLRPRRIMEEVGADYGVLIEVLSLTRSERNVRSQVRTATTTGGGTVRYTVEEGSQRYEIRAEVVLVDSRGARMDSFRASENTTGEFRRAVYDGDVRALDLSRSERMLFDPLPEARVRLQLEETLAQELAAQLGEQVFRRLLRRVP